MFCRSSKVTSDLMWTRVGGSSAVSVVRLKAFTMVMSYLRGWGCGEGVGGRSRGLRGDFKRISSKKGDKSTIDCQVTGRFEGSAFVLVGCTKCPETPNPATAH